MAPDFSDYTTVSFIAKRVDALFSLVLIAAPA